MTTSKSEIRIMHSERGIYEIKFPEKTVLGFLSNDNQYFETVDIPEGEVLKTSSRTEKYRYYKAMACIMKERLERTCAANSSLTTRLMSANERYKHLNADYEGLQKTKAYYEDSLKQANQDKATLNAQIHQKEREIRHISEKLKEAGERYERLYKAHRSDISYSYEFPFFKWLIRIFPKHD